MTVAKQNSTHTHTTFNVWKFFSPPLSNMAFDAEALLNPIQPLKKNMKLVQTHT
jgi:hypothetical protein